MYIVRLKARPAYTWIQKYKTLKEGLEELGFSLVGEVQPIREGSTIWAALDEQGFVTLPRGKNAIIFIDFVFGPSRSEVNAEFVAQIRKRRSRATRTTARTD